jgi:hypothetical protein
MGPNDPFDYATTDARESGEEEPQPPRLRADRQRRIGTAIGASLGLGFGLLVLLLGFWTALLLALVAAAGAGVGRLIGSHRALETGRRILDTMRGRGHAA